jgi:hypothetical protein
VWRSITAVLVILPLIAVGFIHAQEPGDDPSDMGIIQRVQNVAFVEDDALNTASLTNPGAEGLGRLADLFRGYGASARTVTLDAPVPPDVELLVIIRPMRALPVTQTAHLWGFLERGGHLLLALDPNGHNRVNTIRSNAGISVLLEREYGLRLADDFLIEPWFSAASLSDVVTSWSVAYAEDIATHPITEPLVAYDLPLRLWGARSLFVEAVTGNATTTPLIYAESGYGETGRINLGSDDLEPFQRNIGQDTQGRLLLGAVSRHHTTGSRVALIGDSEMFMNIFGQTRMIADENLPRYPGNAIFTERLVAWLMNIPVDTWPTLPEEFTRLALDGNADDWPAGLPEYVDIVFEVEPLRYDIYRTRLFHNDQFLYVHVETLGALNDPAIQVELHLDTGEEPTVILLEDNAVWRLMETGRQRVPDAAYAVGADIELRLPLRIAGPNPVISVVCLVKAELDVTECFREQMVSTQVNTIDPIPARFGSAPSAFTTNDANIRSGPGQQWPVLSLLSGRSLLHATGRNEAGDWIRVESGRYAGWISRPLLVLNIDVERLPVVE